jgi:hypothetical protein
VPDSQPRIAAGGSPAANPKMLLNVTARTGVTQDGAAPDLHR